MHGCGPCLGDGRPRYGPARGGRRRAGVSGVPEQGQWEIEGLKVKGNRRGMGETRKPEGFWRISVKEDERERRRLDNLNHVSRFVFTRMRGRTYMLRRAVCQHVKRAVCGDDVCIAQRGGINMRLGIM
jgi:hypothetical protein